MDINPHKIYTLIEQYGKAKNIPEKSYIPRFCEDFNVNYKQWSAYCRGTQPVGLKIVDFLIDIFPNLNLNWLLKDEAAIFNEDNSPLYVREPGVSYGKDKDIMAKLEAMHKDILQLKQNYNLSQN